MNKNEIIFWNVDTQIDFVEPHGKLYVKDAEKIKPVWRDITDFARDKNIKVLNTADYHHANSAELSNTPDFYNTFPEHCMSGTSGAEFVDETKPHDPFIIDWDKKIKVRNELLKQKRNIVIRKDAFDVFAGNPYTEKIIESLKPENVIVYGVTTNVCVHFAVQGLAKRVKGVYVIQDAIKELDNIPLPFDTWDKNKITMINFEQLNELID